MKDFISILQYEFRHFARSSFKTVSLVLFVAAAVYGLQNGYDLFRKQQVEIAGIQAENDEKTNEVANQLEKGEISPEGAPWINLTTPFWAIWKAPTTAVKPPSPLMPYAIGQAEQFGYYKSVTTWSSTFDSDLAEEIANPERLTTGTLDFSFAVLYLLPILAIILLFNIGGLEKDLRFDQLVQVNNRSRKKWLLARFAFYFLLLIGVLLLLMLPYAAITGALKDEFSAFMELVSYTVFYVLIWFVIFYFVNLSKRGSASQALKMVAVWLLLCIVLPGSIHQVASLKYPTSYMTDYIDANRDETYKLWDLPTDSIRSRLLVLYPELSKTKQGKDALTNEEIINDSSSGLVNELMKNTARTIESRNERKNRFIRSTYVFNPVGFFQNKLNAVARSDYYAYSQFRADIQSMIDRKVHTLLFDSWNEETVTKERYLQYVKHFKNDTK